MNHAFAFGAGAAAPSSGQAQPSTPQAAPTPPEVPQMPQEFNIHEQCALKSPHIEHYVNKLTQSTNQVNNHDIDNNNANIGYAYYLQAFAKKSRGRRYQPNISFSRESAQPSDVKRSGWKDKVFEYSLDVYDEDLECWDKDGLTDEQLIDHFAFIGSEAKRHQEVTIRSLSAEDKAEFLKAKQKELDQWVSNSVFSIVRRAGVPLDRIMAMRWVVTWKTADDDATKRKAKARLVVKGFTDPDLTAVRAESPTLSRLARHWLLQVAASNKWKLVKGDVKTAFLQGSKTEAARNIFVDPPQDTKEPQYHRRPLDEITVSGLWIAQCATTMVSSITVRLDKAWLSHALPRQLLVHDVRR